MNTKSNLNNSLLTQNTITSLGLRGRLFLGFGTIIGLLIIAISIAIFKTTLANKSARHVIDVGLPSYEIYLTLSGEINESQSALTAWLLTHDNDYKNWFYTSWKNIDYLQNQLTNYSQYWSESEIRGYRNIQSYIAQLKSIETKILQDPNPVTLITSELKPLITKINETLQGSVDIKQNTSQSILNNFNNVVGSGTHNIINNMNSLQMIEYGLIVFSIIASIIITLYTARSISRYINIFRIQSTRVASGDLTQRVSIESRDEMGLLGQDLNTMTESLALINKQITDACQNMVVMLTEVKHSVDTQSTGASEQASSINQITASLEEIEKSSAQTIQKAKTLGEVAERTRSKGELGLDAVEQSVNGMKVVKDKVQTIAQTILELSNQTQQVGEITAVVNTLAQQSKMLALNASIEAAKAGEAGKGFAVVATEVKNLAEQSEQSTVQVQKILEDIRHATEKAVLAMEEGTKGVDVGTKLVEQTGEIVKSLNEVIHETTIASQQIEAAIRQEGIGIEQITAGMNEINQVTSSSVASVKETTEAIDNLGTIASNLKKYTDVYKV